MIQSLLLATLFLFTSRINADETNNCGFAPLCGQGNIEFDWEEGLVPDGVGGTVMLAAELAIEDCCKLSDTQPIEDCQIVDPTGEAYRTITASAPICGDGGEDCQDFSCEEYQLVINPSWTENDPNDACCDSCTCFGDPQCISFNGDEKMWVLCDGRDVPHENSIFDMCRITKDQCEKERDHVGNQCVYHAENEEGRGWVVGKEGSPCRPSEDSPVSTIVMYEVPDRDFKLTLEQGERGIIIAIILELECGQFELDASTCLADGEDAWSFTGVDSLPGFFSYNDVVLGYNQHWSIVDPFSGISVTIRCHANRFEGDDRFYVERINIEDLSDPFQRSDSRGFCVTGEFETGLATTANSDRIFEQDHCIAALEEFNVREIYRALCKNPGLPDSAHESCIYHFCDLRHRPLFESIEECITEFESSLAEGFCGGVATSKTEVDKCLEQWFDIGPIQTIQQYYSDESQCVSEVQTSLGKCQSGFVLQFFRNNQWNDEIAIPTNFCPDAGPIVLSYCDHQYLFNRQLRVLQKTANVACHPQNLCQTVQGLLVDISLTQNTPFPTQFPTKEPSPSPTNFPTEFPIPFSVPTPCPVHLCSEEPEDESYDDDSFEFSFKECCPNAICLDTGDITEQTRIHSVETWYCGLSDGHDGSIADSHLQRECEDDDEMTIEVTFNRNQECCKKCTCFGDPRCYSFDGVFEEFVLCDGRTPPASEDVHDRCVIRRETCENQRDHEGNRCAWTNPIKSPPNFSNEDRQYEAEYEFNVAKYGSPCRADVSESSPSHVLMYKAGSFSLEVEQGERGYIQAVFLLFGENEFEMEAESCLGGNDWEVVQGTTPSDLSFTSATYGDEIVWNVEDKSTGIVVRIRCTGHVWNGDFTTPFINVEALLEPDDDRIDTASGFCKTSVISEKERATTDYTADLRANGYCDFWNEDSDHVIQREVARAITNNPGVTNVGVENAYEEFCREFYSPAWSSVSRCVDAFLDASNVDRIIKHFCKAVTHETDACEENLELMSETSGYREAFLSAYTTYIVNFEKECEVDFDDLPEFIEQSEEGCEQGVELQFWNPRRDIWVTYAGFPDSACSKYIVKANHDDHPKLFKNRLRIIQKHDFIHCNQCSNAAAVTASFSFNG